MSYDAAAAAAAIHKHMCNCSKHGYTQGSGRWGGGSGTCKLTVQGHTFSIPGGDYDCSSSAITAWRLALSVTAYKGVLDSATYTGNMRSIFAKSGLFEWKPMSYLAHSGDLYLSESHHVAMCQTQVPDVMSEFLHNENGGIVGGTVGDQTGTESVVHAYRVYSFGWDGILHYNGKADTKTANSYIDKKGNTRYRKPVLYTNPKRIASYKLKNGVKVFEKYYKANTTFHVIVLGKKRVWAKTSGGHHLHLDQLRKK